MHSLPHLHRPERRRFIAITLSAVAVVITVNIVLMVVGGDSAVPASIPSADAAPLSITTDRASYRTGEPVMIRLMNGARNALAEIATSTVTLSAVAGIGDNYGVGMIERETAAGYVAVEPVWRCDGDCARSCAESHAMPPDGTTTLIWDQVIQRCQVETGALAASAAPSGRYRVTAAVWDDRNGSAKLVSSLPFSIVDH